MRWLNLANLLTLARLAMSPVAVWQILRGKFGSALAIFLLAGVTDALDGMLARRAGCPTKLGAYLDPIADKLLLSSCYVALGAAAVAPWWLVALILGRDVLILSLAGAALLFTQFRDFPPTVWGKLNTFVQIVTAVSFLASRVVADARLERWAGLLIWPTAAVTAWSGLDYVWQAMKRVSAAAKAGAPPPGGPER